jgi:hypothetical protein
MRYAAAEPQLGQMVYAVDESTVGEFQASRPLAGIVHTIDRDNGQVLVRTQTPVYSASSPAPIGYTMGYESAVPVTLDDDVGEDYEAFSTRMGQELSAAVNQELASAMVGREQSYAAAQIHGQLREQMMEGDRRAIEDQIRRRLLTDAGSRSMEPTYGTPINYPPPPGMPQATGPSLDAIAHSMYGLTRYPSEDDTQFRARMQNFTRAHPRQMSFEAATLEIGGQKFEVKDVTYKESKKKAEPVKRKTGWELIAKNFLEDDKE